MGISQEVFVYYGWMCRSKPFMEWCDDLDYDLPSGVMLVGMDSHDMVLGVRLFESGSSRWDPMFGEEKWDHSSAVEKLNTWKQQLDIKIQDKFKDVFSEAEGYHAFVDNS